MRLSSGTLLLTLAVASRVARGLAQAPEPGAPAADQVSAAPEAAPASEPTAPVADEAAVDSARAFVEAPIIARNPLDPTAAGTRIALLHRPQVGETLREVLAEAPGARVVSTGALGQFNGVTLRGAELGQTAVLIDDLPIGGPELGAVDLSMLPLAAFEAVEVYRGGAPAWLGEGAIGGVVRLVPRAATGSSLALSATAGRFGTGRGLVDATVHDGGFTLTSSFGAFASRQDFRYVDDRGTRFDPSDDRTLRQRNADVVQRHAFVHARYVFGRSRLDLVGLSVGRSGGFPGSGLRRTEAARATTAQNLASLAYAFAREGSRPVRLSARFGAVGLRRTLRDPFGGVGLLPTDARDDIRSLSLRLAASAALHRTVEATAVVVARSERSDERDRESPFDPPPATRRAAAATLELRHHARYGRTRLEVRGSGRIERVGLRARTLGDFGMIDVHVDDRTLTTGRVGVVVAPRAGLGFSASMHRGVRLPSVLELFGNRTTVAANPELRPESGLGGDAGFVARGSRGPVCVVVEARGFGQALDDVIVFVPTSQFQARARNLGRARVLGLEADLRLSVTEHLDVVANVTETRTRDAAGRSLPFRAPRTVYARATGSLGAHGRWLEDARLYVDVTHTAETFVAPSELVVSPARSFLGLGAQVLLLSGDLALGASVRDLLDARGFDFLGFPLAGRSYDVNLTYRKNFP